MKPTWSSETTSQLCTTQSRIASMEGCIAFSILQKRYLLPHLLQKPGQFHFITGLKFDLFGVVVSNNSSNDIFSLPEGHWPGHKSANEVASMLDFSIRKAKSELNLPVPRLIIHADNCGGQNKNRFILWYLMFRVAMGYEKEIVLYFMVTGHTKNRCDGSFGFVKRKLKERNVIAPQDMVSVVNYSAEANNACIASNVRRIEWKDFLRPYFKVANSFKLNKYRVFRFSSEHQTEIAVRTLSSSLSETKFKLLKAGVTLDRMREAGTKLMSSRDFDSAVVPLNDVPSQQEGTRANYLRKNILERYYNSNSELEENFFLAVACDN